MARRAVRQQDTTIDPMFFIPEGVDELVYDPEAVPEGEEVVEIDVVEDYYVDEEELDTDDELFAPDIFGVVLPQKIRTTSSGAQVVDVLIEVEDLPGVTYEWKFAKND